MRRTLITAVVLGVIGLAALVGGSYLTTSTTVGCGARAMQPGDVCANAVPRNRGVYNHEVLDYEQQRASNQRVGYVAIGFGVLVLGYTAWTVRSALRRPPSSANS